MIALIIVAAISGTEYGSKPHLMQLLTFQAMQKALRLQLQSHLQQEVMLAC